MMRDRIAIPIALVLAASLCTGPDHAITGVETTNGNTVTARIAGTSVHIEAPCGCVAGLFDTAYSPFDTLPRHTDSAHIDADAKAVFTKVPAGRYNTIIWCPGDRQAFLPDLVVGEGADRTAAAPLAEPGRIEAPIISEQVTVLVHIRGTPLHEIVRSGYLVLDDVPPGAHRLHTQAALETKLAVGPRQPKPGTEPTVAEFTLPPGETIVLDALVVPK